MSCRIEEGSLISIVLAGRSLGTKVTGVSASARQPFSPLPPPDILESSWHPFALLRLSAATKRCESREVPDPQVRHRCETLVRVSPPHLYPRRIIPVYFPDRTLGLQCFEAEPDIFSFEETLE